ncbi:MFS transporter [Paenibacillus sp. EPM92]|uniref:MFS transporter n=1 Tax=Paenibacillus sp. EPM92 TaxID=1561195 RepID=UPI001F1AAAB9|nr:MFS transporter [Paenibacillus sp. EPM92]
MNVTAVPFQAKANMLLYAAILFLVEFVRGAFLISFLPAYGVHRLGLSTAGVGIAVSVHYVTDTLIKCGAGYLLDRFSLRLIAPIGLACSLAGLLMMLAAPALWLLALAAALFGVGISPVWLGGLSRVDSKRRASHMGVIYTCWLAGLGSGPVAINFLLDRSYTAAYWLMIGLWGAALVLSLWLGAASQDQVTGQLSLRRQLSLLGERLRAMKALLPGMMMQTTAASMLVPVMPGFAASNLGLSYSQYSLVLIAGGGLTMLGLIPMGKLSDRFGKRWFIVLGYSAFALALFGLTLTRSLGMAVLVASVLGISYAAVLPAWNAVLAQYVPKEQKGLGWGLFSSVEGIGVMIGPVLGGWIADRFSPAMSVLTSAGILGLLALYYLFVLFGALKLKIEA